MGPAVSEMEVSSSNIRLYIVLEIKIKQLCFLIKFWQS